MGSAEIYLIDDDLKLAEVLKAYLEKYSFKVFHFAHPQEGLDRVKEKAPDLVILDIMMPDKDGLQVCREIRAYSMVPIIFLSARGDTTDRIVGLELGADDYLPKPFEPRELVARIESILRREKERVESQGSGDGVGAGSGVGSGIGRRKGHSSEAVQIDSEKMQVKINGQEIELTATEFQALFYLYKNSERIVNRDELLSFLQGIDSEVYGRSIDILISRLRQKMNDDAKDSKHIKTIRGRGYRFLRGQ